MQPVERKNNPVEGTAPPEALMWSRAQNLQETEKVMVERSLEICKGAQSHRAEVLGLDPRGLRPGLRVFCYTSWQS